MDWILEPWPWYVSGPLIALTMFTLLYIGRNFEMSSILRSFCTMGGQDKTFFFFCLDWKAKRWNLLIMLGVVMGGFWAANYLSFNKVPDLNPQTVRQLQA